MSEIKINGASLRLSLIHMVHDHARDTRPPSTKTAAVPKIKRQLSEIVKRKAIAMS